MSLTKKRLNRIKEMIEWIDKTSSAQRKDSLEAFARSHGVDYETVKKDAEVLAYAVIPGFDMRFVPKSLRGEVRNVKKAIERKEIDLIDAGSAVYDFIMMNPLTNVERLNRLYPVENERVRKMQEKIARFIQWIAEEKAKTGIHPMRAQSQAWLEIGKSIHHEMEEVIKENPRKSLDSKVEQLWEAVFLKSQAQLQYEQAKLKLMQFLSEELRKARKTKKVPEEWKKFLELRYGKEKVGKMTEKEMLKRLESDYKNVRRHARPGAERPLSKEMKELLEKEKELRKVNPAFEEIRRHLRMGDTIYKEYKNVNPLKRKRRR